MAAAGAAASSMSVLVASFPPPREVSSAAASAVRAAFGATDVTVQCPHAALNVGDSMTCQAFTDRIDVPLRLTLTTEADVRVKPIRRVLQSSRVAGQVAEYLRKAQNVAAEVECGTSPFIPADAGTTLSCRATALGETHVIDVKVIDQSLNLAMRVHAS